MDIKCNKIGVPDTWNIPVRFRMEQKEQDVNLNKPCGYTYPIVVILEPILRGVVTTERLSFLILFTQTLGGTSIFQPSTS